ncbi:hypothetical protein EDB81DRAFT_808081 [Dactylonectria macrodidyma]|uniref:Uncharacterized protein n=1 Tax=Dactylonectria macrodidyma TaxID=307937 RepID=A0A9P9E5U4_9HYPO|nr:hypothetical protein EDB81DRAFT_808081 [Dactylonectria macrodidyma]
MSRHNPSEFSSGDEEMPGEYTSSMATSAAHDDQYSISTNGFIWSKDAALGQRVSTMREANVPLGSIGGFKFFKQNVVDDSTIMEATRSYLRSELLCLGLSRTLGPVPGAYSFRRSNPHLPVESVMVHLLEKDTTIAIWDGSHQVGVPFFEGEIGLWQTLPHYLVGAGSQRLVETFKDGGYCIRDSRVFMEVLDGHALAFAIGNQSALLKWKPLKLNGLLKPTIEAIRTPKFEINATYEENQGKEC